MEVPCVLSADAVLQEGRKLMGIYIKGAEMPKSCWDCELGNAQQLDAKPCPFYSTDYREQKKYGDKRADGCPLVPVPPHGRLGDLDELAKQVEHGRYHHIHTDGLAARHHIAEYGHFLAAIADFPTIIPAEEAPP